MPGVLSPEELEGAAQLLEGSATVASEVGDSSKMYDALSSPDASAGIRSCCLC